MPAFVPEVLRQGLRDYAGRIAVVSSFGADSAVLLAMVAEVDSSVPVLFLATGQHFPETLAYRRELAATLGLTDVRDVRPGPAALAARDPEGLLHGFDPDACCTLRKTEPLDQALAPFAAWVNGRKRAQSATRANMPSVDAWMAASRSTRLSTGRCMMWSRNSTGAACRAIRSRTVATFPSAAPRVPGPSGPVRIRAPG